MDAKLTAQDVAWDEAIYSSVKVLMDDCNVTVAATSTGNLDVLKRACDLAVEDVISAEVVNDAYTVSPTMQPVKDDFTNFLAYAWSGFNDISKGCSAQDSTLIAQGNNEIQMSTFYTAMFKRDINVAIAA